MQDQGGKTWRTVKRFRGMRYGLLLEGVAVGVCAGALAVGYRLVLAQADAIRAVAVRFAQSGIWQAGLWFLVLAVLAAAVALLLRHEPNCGGSGIPQVEGELQGSIRQHWWRVIWTKIVGGFLCLVGGLSLGREGPSIQLGAMAGKGVSRGLGRMRIEERFLITCGASAGLSAAFNAPLAGVMFALEEVHKSFSPLVLLSAMIASITANALSHIVFGADTIFNFQVTQALPLALYPLVVLLGVCAGAAGALYNRVLLRMQKLYDRVPGGNLTHLLIAFGFAGMLGLCCPVVLGGGHSMIELLQNGLATHVILGLLLLKFVFAMLSFGSGAPGGIFFPLLVLGAYLGGAFGQILLGALGLDQSMTVSFVLLAMAALFTAIVRAPITGIILISEMTGSFQSLYALTVVTIAAYITAEALRSAPIYDSLLARLLRKNGKQVLTDEGEKLLLERLVEHGSPAAGACVCTLFLPEDCLIIGIRDTHGTERIPKGSTRVRAGDTLIVLADEAHGTEAQRILYAMTTLLPHGAEQKEEILK